MVSIIIPTFNRSSLLPETLESVQKQTFKDWECIIVDDGSIDDTEQVVQKIIIEDPRFSYYKRPEKYSRGASSCRNFGFEQSSGKYIQWLDDDDLLSPNKLEFQVEELERLGNEEIFVTSSWDLLWQGKEMELKNPFADRKHIDKENFFAILAEEQTFIPPLAYLVPRSLTEKAGLWNLKLTLNDDAEYFSRVLVHSQQLVNVKDCYVLYREHNHNRLSRSLDYESYFLSLKLIDSHLKKAGIVEKRYFRWKLLKIFHTLWRKNPELIKEHQDFFKLKGINLAFAKYYLLKHSLYKRIYPWYKQNLKFNPF